MLKWLSMTKQNESGEKVEISKEDFDEKGEYRYLW